MVSLCEINGYKVFEKKGVGKYRRGLRPIKPNSLTHKLESRLGKNLQSINVTLFKCHIENLEIHQLGRSLDSPFTGLLSFQHALDDQLYRIEMFGHIVEIQAWGQEL